MQGIALLATQSYRHVVHKPLLVSTSICSTLFLRHVQTATNNDRLLSPTSRTRATLPEKSCLALHDIKEHSSKHPITVFESTTNNVYHNLAIENFLLRNSDPNSRILFFYTNEPCVVIGRNQNPWTECNLRFIQKGIPWKSEHWSKYAAGQRYQDGEKIPLDLVRRRSGGGTVIHDVGNLNFSVIVPNDQDFTRARHAQMVVEALRAFSASDQFKNYRMYDSVRVNERNDIVMSRPAGPLENSGELRREWKVSGSAYKLIRGRAMHHGTLLHTSPNVRYSAHVHPEYSVFKQILTSEAKPFIVAKGVESVPSPVANLFRVASGESRDGIRVELMKAIAITFREMYNSNHTDSERQAQLVTDYDCLEGVNPTIAADANELRTDAWRFEQTPQFTFSGLSKTGLRFHVNKGIIEDVHMQHRNLKKMLEQAIGGKKLHEISGDWEDILADIIDLQELPIDIKRLNFSFPAIKPSDAVAQPEAKSEELKRPVAEQRNAAVIREAPHTNGREVERKGRNLVEETT